MATIRTLTPQEAEHAIDWAAADPRTCWSLRRRPFIGSLREVHCRFGMTGTTQHAALFGFQRKNMPGDHKIFAAGFGIC